MDTPFGIEFGQKWVLAIGLILIAVGAGGIKPCVSANVGDQFGESNQHLLSRVFGWFYFSINLGSSFSIWMCPILLRNPNYGPKYAFGLPGVLMFIATLIFWLGRKKMVHIPPGGLGFLRDLKSKEGRSVLARVWTIYVFTMIFWALWDQSSGGEWTIQCQKLDLNFLGLKFLPEQVQVVNGILILAMIPLFNYWLYPAISRFFPLTPLRKIGIGLFLTALSFVVIWWIQIQIDHGGRPNVGWQLIAYVILSAGEVMVSITGFGIYLHPGAEPDEEFAHGDVAALGRARKSNPIDHQLSHSEAEIDGHEPRRRELFPFLHVSHARDLNHLRLCVAALPRTHVFAKSGTDTGRARDRTPSRRRHADLIIK